SRRDDRVGPRSRGRDGDARAVHLALGLRRGGAVARPARSADRDLCLERRHGRGRGLARASARARRAGRPFGVRLRRHRLRQLDLARADHDPPADRGDGAARGGPARERSARRTRRQVFQAHARHPRLHAGPAAVRCRAGPGPQSQKKAGDKMTEESRRLRSRDWFDNRERWDQTALYLERFMNYGVTPEELRSGKPIIGIAQSGSDLSPCNRIHLDLAKRTRDGIRDAGGIPIEFPVHPIFENCRRPTAALDRNLLYLGLVELLNGYPLDGVVLTTGCDKTTPSQIMAASTVDIPAIVLSGGPMLDGYHEGELVGSGTVIWRSRRKLAAGEIDEDEFLARACDSAPSAGHCNTMGTASTMNAVAEALGLSLTGCAAIPAPYRERAQVAYRTGQRI